MKAQVETISPVKARVFVEISSEEVGQEETSGFRDLQRRVAIPGFRRGKAPVSVLKRLYGDQVRSDALSRLVQKTYVAALKEHEISPVADADIELQESSEKGAVAYTAVVEVRPKVEPRGYRGLTLLKEAVETTEPEVDARLDALRRQHASLEPAPDGHEAQKDDLLTMDYDATVNGEPFDGSHGEGQTVFLGSGRLLPGFDEELAGAKAGEERTFDVTLPEDFRVTEVAGKRATFRVNVKEIKVQRLPDLDEEFAKEAAQVETLVELREKVRGAIEAEKSSRVESEFRERVVDALLGVNPFEVPDALVRRQQAYMLESMKRDFADRGLDMDAMGLDTSRLQESSRRSAERSVRWAFLVDAVANAEGLQVTDSDVDERIRAIAQADGRPYTLIRSFFEKEDRLDSLRSSLREQKVIDLVVSSAEVKLAGREEIQGREADHHG
ncbi:MAG: trigger factor [Deltaproteobacteria bacterium]|nr:trigger factor [Deltaproteobacteria bacterium]